MAINIQCPGCEKNLKAKDELAGKRVKCPRCGQIIVVPGSPPMTSKKVISPLSSKSPVASKGKLLASPPPVAQSKRRRWPWYADGGIVALGLMVGIVVVIAMSGKESTIANKEVVAVSTISETKSSSTTRTAPPREVAAFSAGDAKIDTWGTSVYTSPGLSSIAVEAIKGDKQIVLKDGKQIGDVYDDVAQIHLSPNGRSIAYLVREKSKDKHRLMKDGTVVTKSEPDASWFTFGPDGCLYWNASVDQKRTDLFKEGVCVSDKYDGVMRMGCAFSPDGRSYAFVARQGKNAIVVRDGIPVGEKYDFASQPTYSSNGRSFAFGAKFGSKFFVVKDGKKASAEYQDNNLPRWPGPKKFEFYTRVGQPSLSPDGRSVAFLWHRGGNWVVIRDDAEVASGYALIEEPFFSPDGRSLAFNGIVPEGLLSPGRYACIVVDGKRASGWYLYVFGPVFSTDSRSMAFIAHTLWVGDELIRDGQSIYSVPDGKSSISEPLVFSPDGRSLAFVEQENGTNKSVWVVKDGKRVAGPYARISKIENAVEKRAFIFAAIRGNTVYRVEVPW